MESATTTACDPAGGEEGIRAARALLDTGTALPDAARIHATLDCGLLSWPYLEVWQDGAKAPYGEVFTSRTVQQKAVSGFVHHRNVRARHAAGATLRLPEPGDWLVPLRPLIAALGAPFGPDATATLCLTGPGGTVEAPRPAAGGALLVCSGAVTASWDGQDAGAPEPLGERELRSLPPGRAPRLVAGPDGVLLLVVAGGGRGPREFVRALQELAGEHVTRHPAMRRHHTVDGAAKAEWVRRELAGYFAALDPEDLLRAVAGTAGS